ncbi:N-acetyl-gamma-glutamyl-phosphate reductase [Streptomyces microflavus]
MCRSDSHDPCRSRRASGLAGGELIRLITQHPDLELTFLGGSSNIGRRPSELHPGLRFEQGLTVQPVTEEVVDKVDVLFLATPAPVSAELSSLLADRIPAIVDLSGAFRIRTPELHDRWYPKVKRRTDLADRFVYGVPELIGDQLKDAALISLPGCYATAITLGLAPLTLGLGLDLKTVVVDGKSGSSGGGVQLRTSDLHPFRAGAIAPYSRPGHRHAAEVGDFLERSKPGTIGNLSMSAYGVPNVRGLLTSSYVFTDEKVDQRELNRAYLRFYKGRPFVRVRRHDETLIPVPDPQVVLALQLRRTVTVARCDEEGGRDRRALAHARRHPPPSRGRLGFEDVQKYDPRCRLGACRTMPIDWRTYLTMPGMMRITCHRPRWSGFAAVSGPGGDRGAHLEAPARVVVQGFGAVGRAVARFLEDRGHIVVGVADVRGTISADRLPVAELVASTDQFGAIDRTRLPQDVKLAGEPDAWLAVDADILILAAQKYAINAENAHRLRAGLVVEGANLASSAAAKEKVAASGAGLVPGVIANLGGAASAALAVTRVVPFDLEAEARKAWVFDWVGDRVRQNTRDLLEIAASRAGNPLPELLAARRKER